MEIYEAKDENENDTWMCKNEDWGENLEWIQILQLQSGFGTNFREYSEPASVRRELSENKKQQWLTLFIDLIDWVPCQQPSNGQPGLNFKFRK